MRRYVATIVLAVGALGCFCTPMEGCGASVLCADKCEEKGKCSMRTEFAGDWFYRCYASDDESCAESDICRQKGECHYAAEVRTNACVALTPQDCLESEECKERGRCRLGQGGCTVSHAGCTRSEICREEGKCHLETRRVSEVEGASGYIIERECVAKDVPEDEWCKKACEADGACGRRGKACVATEKEHCLTSPGCTYQGLCSVGESGACVANSDEECEQSSDCEHQGKCVASERGSWCVRTNEVCTGDSCERRGWCTLYKGICRASEDSDCRESVMCRTDGECAVREHLCRPMSDEHCRESEACRTQGECSRSDYVCSPSKAAHCEESLACEIAGLCGLWNHKTLGSRECAASSANNCEQSVECERFGRCMPRYLPNCTQPGCKKVCARPNGPVQLPCTGTKFCKEEGRCLRIETPAKERLESTWPGSQDCVEYNPE